MAGEGDAKARFPRQEVGKGQEHGYLGDVETYDPPEAGHSNTAADKASAKRGKTESGAIVGSTTDADVQATDEGGEG